MNLLTDYQQQLDNGTLQFDAHQKQAVKNLQKLLDDLRDYQPDFGKFRLFTKAPKPPKGLYLYGRVGRGKTMLMNLFVKYCEGHAVRRIHFHEFMRDVHERIHIWRRMFGAKSKKGADPIPEVAKTLAAQAWLICFDEFYVNDITDAMILSRLFAALFKLGVVVVITSNFHPDELYPNGLQREQLLPFIALAKDKMEIFALDGATDYRLDRMKQSQVYFTPPHDYNHAMMDRLFADFTRGGKPRVRTFDVKGHRLVLPKALDHILDISFDDLCGKAYGAEDYAVIANQFHTVFLRGIPQMGVDQADRAKRFMTLIDVLYDHQVKLVASAEATPSDLFTTGRGAFEFQRTASRLEEMQSEDYLAKPHRRDEKKTAESNEENCEESQDEKPA